MFYFRESGYYFFRIALYCAVQGGGDFLSGKLHLRTSIQS